jgi:hypothetical protein
MVTIVASSRHCEDTMTAAVWRAMQGRQFRTDLAIT